MSETRQEQYERLMAEKCKSMAERDQRIINEMERALWETPTEAEKRDAEREGRGSQA